MIQFIDNFLNSITMYRVVLYGLLVLVGISLLFGATGVLFYNPISLLVSLVILVGTCFVTNLAFSKLLNAPTNTESFLITALILFFIMLPVAQMSDAVTLVAAGFVAMASKYVLAIHKKHIFNPAAFAPFFLGLLGNGNALWWAGSDVLLPFVAIIGFLIVRKIRRFSLLFIFLVFSTVTISLFGFANGVPLQTSVTEAFLSWPLIFFGTVMLTEPLTMPPTRKLQMIYGVIVGTLFGSQFHVGPLFSTPEFALLAGNLFAFIVSPKVKLFLKLKEKREIADNTFEFVFQTPKRFHFNAGQYLEWTLPMGKTDTRGNRRYFTIASSPTEDDLKLGVKLNPNPSSFKKKLVTFSQTDRIVASSLTGDFVMPGDQKKKLVFIAGGIGITPFRSMVKYLTDKKEKREITLFYSNKLSSEIAYKDIFDAGAGTIGLKTVYILSDEKNLPANWKGRVGRIDQKMLKEEVPDFMERIFYISGPNSMVNAYKKLLHSLGVPFHNIIVDYFPGF